MKSKPLIVRFALALTLLAWTTSGRGQIAVSLTTLYSFPSSGGFSPNAGLIQGSDGNFYSTSVYGGIDGNGTVYQVTPAGALTILHSFGGAPNLTNGDGAFPRSGLLQGSDGSFYGTAPDGGTAANGTVFKITTGGTFTALHEFTSEDDGASPAGSLAVGKDGAFYGTTWYGGALAGGTVYRMTATGEVTIISDFSLSGQVSTLPNGDLALGSDGNFYGTTYYGGTVGNGTVFRVTPDGEMTVLHNFGSEDHYGENSDGAGPPAGPILGSDGNFYGTTVGGGTDGEGTIFKMTPGGELTTLHSFDHNDGDVHPSAGLIEGRDGNFYGTGGDGGGASSYGTIFQMTPAGTFTTLYRFSRSDGDGPLGLIQGSDGSFYGITTAGGTDNYGTIFKLTVTATQHPAFFSGEAPLANGVYYLAFPSGNPFGYYSYLTDPHYIYHFDLGFEYIFDASDSKSGVYFYDFKSNTFFYSSPGFPFPYLYDFSLNSVVYYYPDPNNAGHYNTNGIRYFYVFNTGQIISK